MTILLPCGHSYCANIHLLFLVECQFEHICTYKEQYEVDFQYLCSSFLQCLGYASRSPLSHRGCLLLDVYGAGEAKFIVEAKHTALVFAVLEDAIVYQMHTSDDIDSDSN